MPNHLASESSPYLRQHADNPVDWYPWGDEGFEKARAEDKPVFLSVGYSACHWCHVMEHESFEDEATAALLNEHFVSIKVDREERPDIDAIYMDAVQAMTGRGGWPMSVFLTPEAMPFYGGTYFPKHSRYGMPSFSEVLTQITSLWQYRRDEVLEAGAALTQVLERSPGGGVVSSGTLEIETIETATRGLTRVFDRTHGGFGGAPKFPQPAVVDFVLRRYLATDDANLLAMVTTTLDAMLRGGIYDQLGGGFHRYSTDERWLVPHFEKMLYDNAQLARLYLHAWQVTGDAPYRRVVTETLDYLVREMLDPAGGFYSAQDADSEGEEGRYFVWTPQEVREALARGVSDRSADAQLFMAAFGVSAAGDFEGRSVLHLDRSMQDLARDIGQPVEYVEDRLIKMRAALLGVRGSREKPRLDDKVLASWNGLTLAAFSEAARVLGRDDYRIVAERNAEFLMAQMRGPEGRMRRTWQNGCAKLNGYLEDHAFVGVGLLELYQTTFDARWFAAAKELTDAISDHFIDSAGGFFDTSSGHESLIVRPKSLQDGAIPSGGAMAAGLLARMAHLSGEGEYADLSEAAVAQTQRAAAEAPLGFAEWLAVLDFILAPPREVAIVGQDRTPLLGVVRSRYRPNLTVAAGDPGCDAGPALLVGREAVDGRATAYVCQDFACKRPVTAPQDLEDLLN